MDRYNTASNAFMHGDPSLIQEAYSHCEDVTVFGGFGGYEHGWKKQVEKRFEWAAARYQGGETKTENISLLSAPTSPAVSTLSTSILNSLELRERFRLTRVSPQYSAVKAHNGKSFTGTPIRL